MSKLERLSKTGATPSAINRTQFLRSQAFHSYIRALSKFADNMHNLSQHSLDPDKICLCVRHPNCSQTTTIMRTSALTGQFKIKVDQVEPSRCWCLPCVGFQELTTPHDLRMNDCDITLYMAVRAYRKELQSQTNRKPALHITSLTTHTGNRTDLLQQRH